MLENKLRPQPFHSSPDLLIQEDGSPSHCPRTMVEVFEKFYQKLYNRLTHENHFHFKQEKFDKFFETLNFPKLSTSNVSMLNAAISPEELAQVVKELPLHKSPGPDDVTYTYYKTFLPTLAPHMLDLYISLPLYFCPLLCTPTSLSSQSLERNPLSQIATDP